MNLDVDNIAEFKIPDVPPWTFSQPRVVFSLHNDKKSQTDPLVFRTKYHELLSDFPNYETIFTNGSKDGDTAGSACVTRLTHINVDYLTMPLFFQRRPKLLI